MRNIKKKSMEFTMYKHEDNSEILSVELWYDGGGKGLLDNGGLTLTRAWYSSIANLNNNISTIPFIIYQ